MDNQAIYYFHQGTNYCAYEYLGAHRTPAGDVVFRVWAPHAAAVSVVGDFNGWDQAAAPMQRVSSAVFEAVLPGVKQYDSYKYCIRTADGRTLFKSDPYASL